MQAVSGRVMAESLGAMGGIAFIYSSQSIEDQAVMVEEAKLTLAGKGLVGAALNTFDYRERADALVGAGVDVLCVDSSDGYTEWQKDCARYVKEKFGDRVIVGGGNIVTGDAFTYLVEECLVDFVKIGIGGGSICTTREQKGIGRGQASAVIDIASTRDALYEKKGIYIPLCSDGALSSDTNIIMALALGADFVMMGKYFAATRESPPEAFEKDGKMYKPYWGEGSFKARNWERYKQGGEVGGLTFEEGVDARTPYTGTVQEKLSVTIAKLKATMCNCGVGSIREFHQQARVTKISPLTIVEGGTSTVEKNK
jgi:IMP dehydrogenase